MSTVTGPILGSWYFAPAAGRGGTDQMVFTFLADGTFLIADKGTFANDPTGQSGLEWGTYTWDQATGAISFSVNLDSDGEWGLSHSGVTHVTVANDIMTLTGSENSAAAARVMSPDATSVVGSWYASNPGGGTDQIAITFLADGTLLVADKGTHANDPTGTSGIEWGTYLWNAQTHELDVNVALNTDDQWGLSDAGGNITAVVTGDTIVIAGTTFTRESAIVTTPAPALALVGNDSVNTLTGTPFNDVFTGLGGNDTISGGAGIDTSLYGSARAAYAIASSQGSITIHGLNNAEGTDTLTSVERLKFADESIAFDVDGNAGTAAKILGAVFGPAYIGVREYMGLGLTLLDGGMSYETLMGLALNVRLGGQAGNHGAVVDLIWNNVFGSAPPQEQHDYYTSLLDNNTFTVPQLAVIAADTIYNVQNVGIAAHATTGYEYL